MEKDTIGIDISKSSLDVHSLAQSAGKQFSNDKSGFKALHKWLRANQIEVIVYEPTGPYHRAFEEVFARKYPLVKINPLQARHFAEAYGTKAKTDKVDARMLALMGKALALKPRQPTSGLQRDLKELQVARLALIKDRTRTMNRYKSLTLPLLKRQLKARIAQQKRQLEQIDDAIIELLQSHTETSEAYQIICSIPGLSNVSAAALLTELPEIGTLNDKQAASLAGLAPMTRQSGQWQGRAYIKGGRKHLRDSMYMPAVVAARHNPEMKELYQRFIAAGKPPKVAFTAIMRKLVILANLLVKQNRYWVPKNV